MPRLCANLLVIIFLCLPSSPASSSGNTVVSYTTTHCHVVASTGLRRIFADPLAEKRYHTNMRKRLAPSVTTLANAIERRVAALRTKNKTFTLLPWTGQKELVVSIGDMENKSLVRGRSKTLDTMPYTWIVSELPFQTGNTGTASQMNIQVYLTMTKKGSLTDLYTLESMIRNTVWASTSASMQKRWRQPAPSDQANRDGIRVNTHAACDHLKRTAKRIKRQITRTLQKRGWLFRRSKQFGSIQFDATVRNPKGCGIDIQLDIAGNFMWGRTRTSIVRSTKRDHPQHPGAFDHTKTS